MIRIGIIGDMGSGKTFVSKCFGLPMFDADLEVKKIYKTNKKCFKKLNKKFPKNIKHFPIKKEEIKQIINKSNLKILSKIVHQYVRISLNKFLKKNYKKKYVILDIPLLIENKLYKKSDIIIGIKAPKKIIIKRLKLRGNYNKRIFDILRKQQFNLTRKIKLCDYVIENNSNKKNIMKQINIIKKKLND